MKKKTIRAGKNTELHIFVKTNVELFGKYVPAFVDILGPTSPSRNVPVINIS